MPFKANASRRHHIPKQTRKVSNWADYNASLRRRGSLTLWFSEDPIAGWRAAPRTTRGGQAWYSPLAILTALTLKAVFRLALRQTEGLIGSIIDLLVSAWRCLASPPSAGELRQWTSHDLVPAAALTMMLTVSPFTCWWTARD